MQKTVILFLCLLTSGLLMATHNRAGEITFEQIDQTTIRATITTFTKASSLPADRDSLEICWGDGNCSFLVRANGTGEILPQDYKISRYVGQHTYNQMGTYQISMTDPARNSGILNVNSPDSDLVPFHLQSTVSLLAMSNIEKGNRSPQILEPPIDVGFVRQTFMHTPNAIDLDGDSVAYRLVSPLMSNGEPVPNYLQVDEIGAGEDNTYSFDETTGLFVWNSPQLVGQYNIAIQINSYRNGELMDMVLRDMQILIQPDGNLPPVIEGLIAEDEEITVAVGETVELAFTATDNEDGAVDGSPDITITGEVLELGASVNIYRTFGANNGEFSWTVGPDAVRTTPYQIAVKAVDRNGLSTFRVIKIKVRDASTNLIAAFDEEGYALYPNPASHRAFLEIPDNLINESLEIMVFDQLGRRVQRIEIDGANSTMELPLQQLENGTYIIYIQSNQQIVSTILEVQR